MSHTGTLEQILKHLNDDKLNISLNVEPGSELHGSLEIARRVMLATERGGGPVLEMVSNVSGATVFFAVVEACHDCKKAPLMLMPTGEMSDFCACCSDCKARTLAKIECHNEEN